MQLLRGVAAFFTSVIAILSVTGREVVIWKAFVEFCRVVSLRGPGKTRIRRKHAWKAKKKWCLVPSRPFVSDQTLKQGSNLFIFGWNPCIGVWTQTRWSLSCSF